MSPLNEDRLTRIEEKVDKLSDAIVSIARAEEKIIQLGTLTDVLFKKIEGMNDKMIEMEKSVAETKAFMNTSVSQLETNLYPALINFFLNSMKL